MELYVIFSRLSENILKGFLVHKGLSDYFDFLDLQGFKKMEEYIAKEKLRCNKKLHHYYISLFKKLIPDTVFETPDIIPDEWYDLTTDDLDEQAKSMAVAKAFEKWVSIEQDSLGLFQKMYSELVMAKEIEASLFVGQYISVMAENMERIKSLMINLSSVDYSLDCILEIQQQIHDEFKAKKKVQ